jgi:Phosphotransferase enzyme family
VGRSSTHEIEMRSDLVIKTYRSRRWDQPRREWRALTLLAAHAPGLAPDPIEADLLADPPRVVMSRLPGVPLREPVTDMQVEAVAYAIRTVQEAVPAPVLADLPPRAGDMRHFVAELRKACAKGPGLGADPIVSRAFEEAVRWLGRPDLDDLATEDVEPVLGTGDGNLANYLWDGARISIVDFEYAGRSDRAFELAEAVEHVSVWGNDAFDAVSLLSRFELTRAEAVRLRESRRLLATYWLMALLPDSPGRARNPPGTLERQAARLLDLLS